MNYLAHLYLSEPTPAFRVGSLLPDVLSLAQLQQLPDAFHAGIARHRQIDAYTDAHPLVRQSIRRISPDYRRFAPVLIDIYYDHLLAQAWQRYAQQPLEQFATEVYAAFERHLHELPTFLHERFEVMAAEDWLCHYREPAGIQQTLVRIGNRLRRPVDLGGAFTALDQQRERLSSDFAEFFPQLVAHIQAR
ncbi:acyl carrier protein phosphodiesterase [Parachitinimonas caeni]|uniref:ACP phosphodiesterase n=1 Tax=Parachitinimonas caeni TaxID=3031301 RepID=A0ABT7DV82_9NEIS|nr:ACP phosphodiesterase [Parachitinimonas caeni]MDK2123977.1 ACP phosphodiesterase [Parachitinimonas caeni]